MQPKRPPSQSSHVTLDASQGHIDSFALLLHRMINRIRQSLELSEILTTTVAEVRAFLKTDRVKIYRFDEDGSGEVIAEAIHDRRLPSLLGHSFPAEDIPEEARRLFVECRQRSIVDVVSRTIGESPLEKGGAEIKNKIYFRSVDPCHVEYLTAMGVCSSLVVPILDKQQLWGLLVSHHSAPRQMTERELQVVQIVADQVSIAIAQSNLLHQARVQAAQEATINRVTSLLHCTHKMQLREALKQTVIALQGVGGRIYIMTHPPNQTPQVVTYGNQPRLPDTLPNHKNDDTDNLDKESRQPKPKVKNWRSVSNSPNFLASPSILEQHHHWQTWLDMEEPVNPESNIWMITDLYRAVMPSDLSVTFLNAQIRGLLIAQLQYRQKLLGYLTVFRQEIDVERVWAGRPDRDDPRQRRPRESFETWRELKCGQAHPWTAEDFVLIQALSSHFAVAIHQRSLYQQVCALNSDLERDIQKRKQAERKISILNAQLEQRVLERTSELQTANEALLQQINERERALLERRQAEASLARLSHQNELILNSAGEGIYGLDAQGRITFVNPAAARILGYEVNELIGGWMHTLLNPSQQDGTPYLMTESPIYRTLQQGVVQHSSDDLFCRRDGSSFPVEYVSSPIREQGKIVGAVVLFKDITARQQVEQLKDEFVSVVSHELRTPLTSIRSTLGLLASGWLNSHPEKSQRMLEIAFSNTNRLVRLISDILDIERIKFGKVTMEKEACDVADLMLQSADAMRAMAEKSEITLAVTPVATKLWADPDRIIQTLTNLLSNAIKFSPSGSTVWLTAQIIEHENQEIRKPHTQTNKNETFPTPHPPPSTPYIIFQVKDQGIGIPADKLEAIFDRFQQVDASNSRTQGGTGLGLTICRGIVQQHDGQIWVESQLGEGSQFYIALPLAKERAEGDEKL
jgi:PAS domain S-box-containing protein